MNRLLLNILVLSITLFFFQGLIAQQRVNDNDEKPVVLFTEFEFDAKNIELAIELLTEMQNQTYENEEGCMMYDLLISSEKPNTIYVYECYENNSAVKLHNNSSYFKNIVENKLLLLIKSQKTLTLIPINDMGVALE